jgi:hypothetical protein
LKAGSTTEYISYRRLADKKPTVVEADTTQSKSSAKSSQFSYEEEAEKIDQTLIKAPCSTSQEVQDL